MRSVLDLPGVHSDGVAYASELDPFDCAERPRSNRLSRADDFGSLGRAYCEASEDRSDLETTISDLMSGQYDNPARVVAFNTAERWPRDVSEDIAREIMRRVFCTDPVDLIRRLGFCLLDLRATGWP